MIGLGRILLSLEANLNKYGFHLKQTNQAAAPAPMESMMAELKARKNRQAKKISPNR